MFSVSSELKKQKFVTRVMELMETEGLSIGEAEVIPNMLESKIKENGELIEKSRPFAVYQDPANLSGNS